MTVHHQDPSSSSSGGANHNGDDVSGSNNLNVVQQQQQQQVPKATRPKPVSQWNVADVQKWLRRHCCDLYHLYSELFLNQDITGRSLIRLNENSLLRLGIVHPEHRQAILKQISKLRLKSNIMQLLHDTERA